MQYAEPTTVSHIVAIERLNVRKCQMAASRAHRPLVRIFGSVDAAELRIWRTTSITLEQSTDSIYSPLLRRPEFGCSLCGAPPTRRPSQNPRATVALKHAVRYNPIDRKWTEPHKAVLARHITQHPAHRNRVGDLLFWLECAATASQLDCSKARRCSAHWRAFQLPPEAQQHGKPRNRCLCANMGRLRHDARHGAEGAI
jgi:hypothetical protein